MADERPLTMICLASDEKGGEFMRAAAAQGCKVFLLTQEKLAGYEWPREILAGVDYVDMYDRKAVIEHVSYMARGMELDRIVALEEFDVETASALREHLRLPGMGDTTARYFRDKLAMRVKTSGAGIPGPRFAHVLNYDRLRAFMAEVPAPWVLKPRADASALGIRKIYDAEQLWRSLDQLGHQQSHCLLEEFVAGDIFHVDAIVAEREVIFVETHQYCCPILELMEQGAIFGTFTVERGSADDLALRELNRHVIEALGMVRGVTHTEFIKGADGRFYFLESAARVGGARITDMIEASTGLNLWREWASLEIAGEDRPYVLPPHRQDYAGLVASLARQEYPDTGAYDDPEIVWRLNQRHHAGLIAVSPDQSRVRQLVDSYRERFKQDFFTHEPPPATARR
ncbi:MAG TPA: ATP-grasp domain-containing protein [Herpetosiphonaceae bacterium]